MKYSFSLLLVYLLFSRLVFAEPFKNQFDLVNSSIPISQILSGGPPRDGIPSIDNPKFVAANQADFLTPDDRVLGVIIQGEARAYPIKILNWHEIVNDVLKTQAITVTFCPLCGSGIVYSSMIDGKVHHFGVSGLLYNSDVLLYDRETKSLWSQLLSKGVSGKLRDKPLTMIPSSHTSWAVWMKKYPNTRVLSTDTGYSRDYNKSPYGTYNENNRIYFPMAFKSQKYHPKERVIGVSMGDKHKVYPFSELAKLDKKTLKDRFAGKTLLIEFDAENRDGVVKDNSGRVIPSVNSFWFAWYAFHPDAVIFKANK